MTPAWSFHAVCGNKYIIQEVGSNMKVITLLNEKGGVGKTTLALHIAAGLAINGRRVVVVDADPQANLSMMLTGSDAHDGVYRLTVKYDEWSDVLIQPGTEIYAPGDVAGELYVLPGNVETRLIPLATSDVAALDTRLRDLEGWADIVVIDTPPTPSLLQAMIYAATDYIIYPSKAENLSLQGLSKSVARLEELNRGRALTVNKAPAEMMAVLPTMYDVRTLSHDYGISLMAKYFKNSLWPPIPHRTKWQDAQWKAKKTVFAYAPGDVATDEAWALVGRVERGLGS